MEKINEEFNKIIDNYITNYTTYNKGKHNFECDYGEIIFNKEFSNVISIFGILITTDHRQKGAFKQIIQYLIDKFSKLDYKYLCVQSVISKPLYEYLLRFKYKNRKFVLNKLDGDFYFLLNQYI